MSQKHIAILSGAGISAESGLKTFRDSGGLWEGHDVMSVASLDGWKRNPQLVLDFYNIRRRQLLNVIPNKAHIALAQLQQNYEISIITQNVDDLHERAGNENVTHLHGELLKVCSSRNPDLVYPWKDDLKLGDVGEDGAQLRPYIVWFGESVPMMELAAKKIMEADVLFIIGTSLQVYPAASLVQIVPDYAKIIYVDPSPSISYELKFRNHLSVIQAPATTGVPRAIDILHQQIASN